jgi:hypothetical protein
MQFYSHLSDDERDQIAPFAGHAGRSIGVIIGKNRSGEEKVRP